MTAKSSRAGFRQTNGDGSAQWGETLTIDSETMYWFSVNWSSGCSSALPSPPAKVLDLNSIHLQKQTIKLLLVADGEVGVALEPILAGNHAARILPSPRPPAWCAESRSRSHCEDALRCNDEPSGRPSDEHSPPIQADLCECNRP